MLIILYVLSNNALNAVEDVSTALSFQSMRLTNALLLNVLPQDAK